MTLFLFCLIGTGASYWVGVRSPGRGWGTPKGWLFACAAGLMLGVSYYAFSAYGLLFTLDSVFQ